MNIGITLTSSLGVESKYIHLTEQVATKLAQQDFGIVYGGTAYGMMATLATAYKATGGTDLTGVMAKDLMAITKDYSDDLEEILHYFTTYQPKELADKFAAS
jgi:predicted Rossmann-fold nucleotide-binding protein